MNQNEKLQKLKMYIKPLEKMVVAFSGGVDSSFLLKVAHDLLGEGVLAVTARSSTYPEREYKEAVEFAQKYGINHKIIVSEELDVEGFSENPPDRCYLCKKELFAKIKKIASENEVKYVAEGSNIDDLQDYRPGFRAVEEFSILSPLREVGLTKNEIRSLSKDMGLKTWDKPSFACLSSRFPYGNKITEQKLGMVDKAEQFLLDLGFRQVRVRHHDTIARIEVYESEIQKIIEVDYRKKIDDKFKEIGFKYTAIDIMGYRTGSMNDTLSKE
jgi:uncharacterized protein